MYIVLLVTSLLVIAVTTNPDTRPPDIKLPDCQHGSICQPFGQNANLCDNCCKDHWRSNGHCGSFLGQYCWCSGRIWPPSTTTKVPTTTIQPTTAEITTQSSKTTSATTVPTTTTKYQTSTEEIPTTTTKYQTSTEEIPTTTVSEDTNKTKWAIVIGTISASLICVVVVFCIIRFKMIKAKERQVYGCEINTGDSSSIPYACRNENEEEYNLNLNAEYQIPTDSLQLDYNPSNLIGEGKYGMIFRGRLLQNVYNDRMEWCDIAIKSVKPNSRSNYSRALLGEIRILSCFGQHTNVLRFLGYHSSVNENTSRTTLLFLELCENGNLKNFLAHNYSNFISCLKNDQFFRNPMLTNNTLPKNGKLFSTKHLLEWSSQIACGMEFLVSKKVIHNDVAARNILLTTEMVAKISDFGLSRIMDRPKQTYTKKSTEDSIPWPWMAPESLKSCQYSTESDIWSYGVTLWEIYTLGDDPNQSFSDDLDLLTKLHEGCRLGKPCYASCEIYIEILLCWRMATTERPTFENLKVFFRKQSETLQRILDQAETSISNMIKTEFCSTSSYSKQPMQMQSYRKWQ